MKKSYDNRFEGSKSFGDLGFGVSGKVITDTQTGVQYLLINSGYGGELCVLVDREGKPLLAEESKMRL